MTQTKLSLADYKPALRFLALFVGLYIALNVLYGVWIISYGNAPDAMTKLVAQQTAGVRNAAGLICVAVVNPSGPTVYLKSASRKILNVYEGCNGLNVMIVFVAFIIAFNGPLKKMAWFIPVGFVLIHLANLVRVLFLYYLAESRSHYFYYFHKYFFTACIYLMVFALWWIWVRFLHQRPQPLPTDRHW